MTTVEAEWDDDTRSLALALEHHKGSLCPVCGLPAAVCQAGENEFEFEADGPYRCHAATAVAIARTGLDEDTPAASALMFIPKLKSGGVSGG